MPEFALQYEENYAIHINQAGDPLFYYFDYGKRSHSINMRFQHFHDFYEIHILMEQNAAHIIEGDLYDIQQYDIVLLRPALLHKTQYPEGPPLKRLVINFAVPNHLPGLESAYEEILSIFREPLPIFRFTGEARQSILSPINDIFCLSKSVPLLNPVAVHCKFTEFLYALYRHKQENGYRRKESGSSMTQTIYSIASFIHSHYKQELSLDFISKKFYISSHYLSHQFNKTTGFTLTEYIQMTRIRNAQQRLANTTLKITEIAEQCGFTSFSQFNRTFNKFNGMSPSAFRRSKRAARPLG